MDGCANYPDEDGRPVNETCAPLKVMAPPTPSRHRVGEPALTNGIKFPLWLGGRRRVTDANRASESEAAK